MIEGPKGIRPPKPRYKGRESIRPRGQFDVTRNEAIKGKIKRRQRINERRRKKGGNKRMKNDRANSRGIEKYGKSKTERNSRR